MKLLGKSIDIFFFRRQPTLNLTPFFLHLTTSLKSVITLIIQCIFFVSFLCLCMLSNKTLSRPMKPKYVLLFIVGVCKYRHLQHGDEKAVVCCIDNSIILHVSLHSYTTLLQHFSSVSFQRCSISESTAARTARPSPPPPPPLHL